MNLLWVLPAISVKILVGVASSGDTGCRVNSVYARVAPAVAGFIEPTLAIGPLERPPAGNTCGGTCMFDADCPDGLVCVPNPSGEVFSCALPGEAAGAFGEACTIEGACSEGFCAETGAEDACRCYVPCGSAPSSGGGGRRGCSAAPGLAPSGAWLLAFLALAWARRRR